MHDAHRAGRRHFLQGTAALAATTLLPGLSQAAAPASATSVELLNVSYDPTRELYAQYNPVFEAYWKKKNGQTLKVNQSHGGSGAQARTVIDGVAADVVTLGMAPDINALVNKGLVRADWASQFPNDSAAYTSTIIFLVRKGNPKNIRDWDDLTKAGVGVITPNPKTSSGAQWNYLAAWAYAEKKYGTANNDAAVKDYLKKVLKNAPVLDTGARGSTISFVQRGLGDVLLAWENEAFLALKEFGPDKFEIVVPSLSILCVPPVAVVDKNVDRHGTREVAHAYLSYLWTEQAQDIIARNFYRPVNATIAKKYASQFPKVELVTIEKNFGGWKHAQQVHFADGGTFDQVYGAG